MTRLAGMAIVVAVAVVALVLSNCAQHEKVDARVAEEKEQVQREAEAEKRVEKESREEEEKPVEKKEEVAERPPVQEEKQGEQAQIKALECESFYHKSLHATGEGMRYWYEENNGFMQITGIPYKELDCKSCHASSCDKCHAVQKDGVPAFSLAKARDMETCLGCHVRTKAAMAMDEAAGIEDVHFAAGMDCTDCHSAADVHGDGKSYQSMRDPGAVKASCSAEDCHDELDMTIRPHKVHKKKNIDCAACHVSSTITCLNCHFDKFLEEKSKKGNFFKAKSWTLLVNYKGKVTTGNAQTLVSKGKKFVTYVPYFTHSVIKEGRKCGDCHGAQAATKMAKGKRVKMATFANGKLTHHTGVVPYIPELIEWPWLDKITKDVWIELDSEEKPHLQQAAYAEPITEKQLKKLKVRFRK